MFNLATLGVIEDAMLHIHDEKIEMFKLMVGEIHEIAKKALSGFDDECAKIRMVPSGGFASGREVVFAGNAMVWFIVMCLAVAMFLGRVRFVDISGRMQ